VTVIAVFGPTASGKTAVAEAIADRIPAELVSADAMQVYGGLPILTNQSERPAHLVAIWPLEHDASVAEYQRLAHEAIDGALERGRTPIVVGGTGLYLRAALSDLKLPPAAPAELRAHVEAVYERVGGERAHALLAERDAEAAARVHPSDRRRVVRALELAELGTSLAGDELWSTQTRHPTMVFGLDVPREVLWQRIEERTRAMFERGVEEEVRAALGRRVSSTAGYVHGLRDIASLSPADACEALVLRTRRYAAYQRRWMRRIPGLVTVSADRPVGEIADEILEMARARQHIPASGGGAAHPG
jgi:tRNA dimethylallyltransferase